MNVRRFLAALALVPAALAGGCGAEDTPPEQMLEEVTDSTQQPLPSPDFEMPQNGLHPGSVQANYALLWRVWQHPLTTSGFQATLSATPNVQSLFNTGLPTSAEKLMEDIVSCALDLGHDVKWKLEASDPESTWHGQFGLCDMGSPFDDWSAGPASSRCRQVVSACVLARMNARGKHVPISIRIPNESGNHPVDTSRFRPVDKVRVQTILRDGTRVGRDWRPEFVGICKRGQWVTMQRNGVTKVRVCKGIHGCELDEQISSVPGTPHVYAGFVQDFVEGNGPITFECPGDVSTAPNGKPGETYFSILVSPGAAPDPIVQPISGAMYPATERQVFTYPEGAFFGNILPNPGVGATMSTCYSDVWRAGTAYFADRVCLDPAAQQGCYMETWACNAGWSGGCQGRSPAPEEAYYDCMSDVDEPLWPYVATVFLNEPASISQDPNASALGPSHDPCTPGTPLADGSSPVVTSVCAADPYCCSAAWDKKCVSEVETVAKSDVCACGRSVCTTGAALIDGCNAVVASVCDVDPYCCTTAWDNACVDQVQSVANSLECACSHPVCTTGAPLDTMCGSVEKLICSVDPYCCDTAWDSQCVNEVQSVANHLQCVGGTCSHTLCATGAPLTSGCDVPPLASPGCAASICAADPYCCNTAWDNLCVDEVSTVCGKTCN